MPAPRAVLADLLQYGLDPTKEYKTTNANGRLGKDRNVVLSEITVQTVELQPQPVQQIAEPKVAETVVQEPEVVEQPVVVEETVEKVVGISKLEDAAVEELSKSILEAEDTKILEKVVEESTKKRGKKSLDK